MRRLAPAPILAAALALAGCAEQGRAPDAGAPGLPLARATPAAGADSAATGEARLTVRPTVAGRDAPADCTASGPGFSAAFAAPAVLAVPTYGSASGQVRIDCASGGLRGARIAEPQARPANGIAGWPAVGVGVSSGGDSYVSVGGFWNGGWGTGPETWSVRYPDVEVPLE